MKEIKFRGKRIDNGDWVYGYYRSNDLGNHLILKSSATFTIIKNCWKNSFR